MSMDKYMIELFLSEANAACARIRECSTEDNLLAAESARAAAGAAKMVGINQIAELFLRLEVAYSADFAKAKGTPSVVEIFNFLQEISSLQPEVLLAELEKCSDKIKTLLASESCFDSNTAAKKSTSLDEVNHDEQNVDLDMFDIFLQEADSQLSQLSENLLGLEKKMGDVALIDSLMRICHSLKGAARVVSIGWLVELAHAMEDCFLSVKNGKVKADSTFADIMLECTDFITSAVAQKMRNINPSESRRLVDVLLRLKDGVHDAQAIPTNFYKPSNRLAHKDLSFVKVSAKNLSKLMELAAESLVETRRIEPYSNALMEIKNNTEQIARSLENAIYMLEGCAGAEAAQSHLEQARLSMRKTTDDLRLHSNLIAEYSRRSVAISDKLYSEVMESRMRPFSDGVVGLPRMVRDIAKSIGKKIDFEIEGARTAVDRDVLEKLEAPLMHIVRNACDHGIEFPEERIAMNKEPSGKIVMRAWHSSGFLKIMISDDGRGISEASVKKKISERGLVNDSMLDSLSHEELYSFLLLPGFTTKSEVGEISGRGVGLDVVQNMLHEVGGTITIESSEGAGAVFTLRLPITRSVMKALVVNVSGEPYAFALARVYKTLKLKTEDVFEINGRKYFKLGNRQVGLANCSTMLGFDDNISKSNTIYVIVVSNKENLYGLVVDELPSEAELVVRPLNENLGKIPDVSAVSLNEDGLPILILDVDDIISSMDKFFRGENLLSEDKKINDTIKSNKKILVVDDSTTVRETQRRLLEGTGYLVDVAVDGMDGWNSIRLKQYDIVITDIDMPRMNGFELIERIRENSDMNDIPIMVVSYKDRDDDKNRAISAGANAYLAKSSFSDDSFIKTVSSLLNDDSKSV